MPNVTAIIILCVIVIESFLVFSGNIFTIFVFWKHRNRLKRTSFLLIDVAVADLLVGLISPIVIGTIAIPQHITSISISFGHISTAFSTTFYFASLYFLVFISLERAYALIWPLRHRVASTKGYIYSVILVWICGILAGTLSWLAVHGILNVVVWHITLSSLVILALVIICGSYLAIRRRLNSRVPAIDMAHKRQKELQQSQTLSKTLFMVIAASLLFWFPSTVGYFIDYLCTKCVPLPVRYSFTVFHLANSLVNPLIYSFRIPMFREALKRMKLHKHSKRYRVTFIT